MYIDIPPFQGFFVGWEIIIVDGAMPHPLTSCPFGVTGVEVWIVLGCE